MAPTPDDDRTEPSLELPSLRLPGFRRRRHQAQPGRTADAGPAAAPAPPPPSEETDTPEDPTPPDVPLGEPRTEPRAEPRTGPTQLLSGADGTDAPVAGDRRRVLPPPDLPGRVATAMTGVVVGLGGATATYAALTACEAVRGVSTCGGGPGFLALVAIVALMALGGAQLLTAFRVKDPGSSSVLAVGIVTVAVMLLLLDVILSPWMFAVIPALSAAAYLLAHWVSTRFDGTDDGRRDWT